MSKRTQQREPQLNLAKLADNETGQAIRAQVSVFLDCLAREHPRFALCAIVVAAPKDVEQDYAGLATIQSRGVSSMAIEEELKTVVGMTTVAFLDATPSEIRRRSGGLN